MIPTEQYNEAYSIWMGQLVGNPEFIEKCRPIETNDMMSKLLETLGRFLFKKQKPEVEDVKLHEYPGERFVHGFAFVKKG